MERLDGAHEILESLVGIYRRGQDEILPFFPGTSQEYADCMETDRNEDRALRRAASAWAGSNYARGDAQDPYFDLGFGRVESGRLFDGRFASLAMEVFRPMLAHQKGKKR
jgi:exodeoxyribonuclease V gamma subunit